MDEDLLTAVEPGVVADDDLANALFEIPAEEYSPSHTPSMVPDVEDEDNKSGTETEVEEGQSLHEDDLPVGPSLAAESGYATEQSGAPPVDMAWPLPVLEGYPLTLVLKDHIMGPQPVSPGGTSPGAQSSTSTQSEEATPQPILITEDVEVIEEMTETMPELFIASLAGSFKEGKLRCIFRPRGDPPRSACWHVRSGAWAVPLVIRGSQQAAYFQPKIDKWNKNVAIDSGGGQAWGRHLDHSRSLPTHQ